MRNDLRAGVLIIVFSLLYLLGANAIPQAGSNATVGPRAFPLGIGVLMLISGIWLALVTARKQRAGIELVAEDPVDWRAFCMAAGMLVAYALLQPWLGFLICTPLLMFGEAWVFGSRNWKRDAIVSVGLTALIYLAFTQLLNIRLG